MIRRVPLTVGYQAIDTLRLQTKYNQSSAVRKESPALTVSTTQTDRLRDASSERQTMDILSCLRSMDTEKIQTSIAKTPLLRKCKLKCK